MAETITIRLSGPLRRFIDSRSCEDGLYESASEYLRDLVRHDFEKEERRKWASLISELQPALKADESEFVPFDVKGIIAEAQAEYGEENQ